MNAESPLTSLPFNRMLNLASIGLLALMIFGLARLGFGVVPVWILAVPFVLLASLDIESCFSRARTFSARLMPVAFHFVIIATVLAAHQQIGAVGSGISEVRPAALTAGKSSEWGCAAGGCGSSGSGAAGGGCGGACGGVGASSAAGGAKSACGCGGGKATANSSRPAGSSNPTASKRTATKHVSVPLPVNRAASAAVPGVTNIPLPANAVGPRLGAGLQPPPGAGGAPTVTSIPPPNGAPASQLKAPLLVPNLIPSAPLRPAAATIRDERATPVAAPAPAPATTPAPLTPDGSRALPESSAPPKTNDREEAKDINPSAPKPAGQ